MERHIISDNTINRDKKNKQNYINKPGTSWSNWAPATLLVSGFSYKTGGLWRRDSTLRCDWTESGADVAGQMLNISHYLAVFLPLVAWLPSHHFLHLRMFLCQSHEREREKCGSLFDPWKVSNHLIFLCQVICSEIGCSLLKRL